MKKLYIIILFAAYSVGINAQYTNILNFAGTTNGAYPGGSPFFDGTFFYGTTSSGGTSDSGTIYKIKPDGTGYSKLLDFTGSPDGSNPYSTLISDGTFLYGTTNTGGSNNLGTVFKIKPDGTGYSKLLDFTGTNGSYPSNDLIYDGSYLYGTTYRGGTGDSGTIFKIMPNGTGYVNLLSFTGGVNGTGPNSLFSDGTFLYGMTEEGGTNGVGIIFKIKPDGTGYSKLLDFTGANGNIPFGTFISDGTFLYGITYFGGANGSGNIFKIKPDGTGYADLYDFIGGNTDGQDPNGSLIYDGTFLYGMTNGGGTNHMGTLFEIKLDGTGYSKLFDFLGTTSIGGYPNASLFYDGNSLYGTTFNGGTDYLGTVFKFHAAGMGIAENKTEIGFNIFPNPTSGQFNLSISQFDNLKMNSVGVYNVYGEKIYSTTINSTKSEIDLSKQSNGIYFVQLKTEQGTATQKLIINR